jgi:hypothetical protein
VPERPVADDELDFPDARCVERLARATGELGVALDRDDTGGQPREHRGVVPGPGADVQHGLVAPQLEQLAHAGDDGRLRDRLPLADRQRRVHPRLGAHARRDEELPRHGADRRQHAPVGDVRRELVDQVVAVHLADASAPS